MSLVIRTNYASLEAQRNLSNTQTALEAQVSSYSVAARNANDGISVAQTAEGALNAVTNILSRMRELVMQKGSAVSGTSGAIDTEITSLQTELARINTHTEFNNTTLFGAAAMNFQVGIRSGDTITLDMSKMDVSDTGLKVNGALTGASLAAIDTAIDTVSGYRATLGAAGNQMQSAISSIQAASTNLSAADSRIRDVDVAEETSKLSRNQVLAQAGISVLAQANQLPQMALKLLG